MTQETMSSERGANFCKFKKACQANSNTEPTRELNHKKITHEGQITFSGFGMYGKERIWQAKRILVGGENSPKPPLQNPKTFTKP